MREKKGVGGRRKGRRGEGRRVGRQKERRRREGGRGGRRGEGRRVGGWKERRRREGWRKKRVEMKALVNVSMCVLTSHAPTHLQFNRCCSVEWSLINLRHVVQPQQEVGGVYLLQRQEVHVGRETLCYTYIL